jgi:hypothetical protein
MTIKFLTIVIALSCTSNAAHANEQKSVFLGHLLTPTTYTPKKKTVTAGSHVLGYSVNDNLLVGTSTFLALFYNSPNLFLKYSKKYNEHSRWAVQFDYLKSSNKRIVKNSTLYEMEAVMIWGLWSKDITPFYTIHTSLNYMYFINEGKPHSLRREPFNDQPFQFAITSLHEVKISERYGLASEIGVLGVNYTTPNLHLGVSFRYMRKNYLIQIGMSLDNELWGRDKAIAYAAENQILDRSHTTNLLTHPELSFQYFF